MRRLCILYVMLFETSVYSLPSGAPSQACSSLTPNHGGSSQSSPLPYTLNMSTFNFYNDGNSYYEPGNTYQLTLSGDTFRGFLLQARLLTDDITLVGSFSNPSTDTQLSSCTPSESGITHTSNSDKVSITGTWTAPPIGTGPIRFRFAVVQEMAIYWADQMSSVVYESGVNMLFDGDVVANNSVLIRGQVGEDEDGITCTSENIDCCIDTDTSIGWFNPDGTALHEGADGAESLYVTRGVGFVRLNRITGGMSALYWCDVPDYSGTLQRFYVGLYTNSLTSGIFSTLMITFEMETELTSDPPQFSLTCRSEGGPATMVEWERDGVIVQDDSNHSTSQIVLNAAPAVYHNVLVVTGREGGEYTCTVTNAKTTFITTTDVEVGTDPTNLVAIQQDGSAMSITVTWELPTSPTPAGSGFVVIYETAGSTNSINVDFCTECGTNISGLMTGSTYSISVITVSAHLPSNRVGPVVVTLATGCIELGYTEGCCMSDAEDACVLDLPGTEDDCFCSEQCYSLLNCCQDILLSCSPPDDAKLCALFRGYECDVNAQCLSTDNEVNDSASYQCVCNEGYIGDGNTTCLGASVEVNPPAVLATNGTSGLTITCVAPSFPDGDYHWILVDDDMNNSIATGGVLELQQVVFGGAEQGARYQCIVETQFGNIFSDIVEVVVSPEEGVSVEPSMASVERNESVTLTCSSQGGPRNTFKWTRPSTGLQVSSESSLVVAVSSGVDGGVYRCHVENDAGSDTADATIIVPPVFEISPVSTSVQLGDEVTLQCAVDGYPTPNIMWEHYSTVVRENAGVEINVEIVNSTTMSTLHITTVQTDNYGQYTCRVNIVLVSEPATISFAGTLSADECEVLYNLTESFGSLTVSSTGTVCFQCLNDDSVDPAMQWMLESEPISSSIGTMSSGYLAIFTAVNVFGVDESSTLQCMGTTDTYIYAVTIRALVPPIIPDTVDVLEHDDIFITCDSSGSIPVISHTWTDAGGTVVSTNAELTLLNVTRAQESVYTCTIEDDIGGTASATTRINVQSIPTVLDFTSSPHYVLIGEQLQLFCMYSGVPDPDTYWLVNGSTITNDSDISVSSNATYSVLTVENVTGAYDGTYNCDVSNAVGSDQVSIDVDVVLTPPPADISITTTGSSIAGQAYTLTCSAVLIGGSIVTVDVQWLDSDGRVVLDGDDVSIGDVMTEGVKFSRSLTFEVLLASQAGAYICQASFPDPQSSLGNISSNQTIIVTVQIPAPLVSLVVPPQPIYEGTSTAIACTANINTAVDTSVRAMFEWTIEGASNFSESRFNFTETSTSEQSFESVLHFNPISLSDSGVYSCSVVIESLTQLVEGAERDTVADVIVNELPPPTIEITDSGDSVAGETLSLNCSVTTVESLVLPPQVEFIDVLGQPLMQQGIQLQGPITEGRATFLTLEFSPLLTSMGGQYMCRAIINIPEVAIENVLSELTTEVTVTIPSPSVLVMPGNENTIPYAAIEYCLVCQIDVTTTYVDTETEAMVTWLNSDEELVNSDSRISVSDTQTVDGGYTSTLTLSPLSLIDNGNFMCSVLIAPDNTSLFVAASTISTDTHTLNVMAPPNPNVTFSINGSATAGEDLQLVCISEFIQGLYRLPLLVIIDQTGVEVDPLTSQTEVEGLVQGTVLLAPLMTSHNGLYTCVSSYDFPEAGLIDSALYSTRQSLTVTVSIPIPQLTFSSVPNETYVGTRTYLYCTVQLDAAVNSIVQANISFAQTINSSTSSYAEDTSVIELSNNTFQSSIVFSPLVSEDEGIYTCTMTIEFQSSNILGTAVEGVYSLIPLDTPEPVVVIVPQQSPTLGTNVLLTCSVTVVEGVIYPPLIDWVQLPDPNTTTINPIIVLDDGRTFERLLEFSPLLESHGGLCVCAVRLMFPNTSLPHISSTQNYSLIVQAPVPIVVIKQSPMGNLIEGAPVSLTCTASIPLPNALTFEATIRWLDSDMSEVLNSSDGRIEVGLEMTKRPNEFQSILTINAINAELDNAYSCYAEVNLQEQREFVTTQPGTSTIALIILGPPTDFVVTATTQTSISFTWGLPLTTSPVIEYALECQSTVMGVDDPSPLTTTEQSALLPSLSPGVPYSCSLNALTDTNTPPPATITATTAESAPTGPPRMFTAVSVDARTITFTWEAPEPHLRNGVILSYTIICDPSPSSPLGPVTQAGNIIQSRFSPLTFYSCSISARNSVGSGPVAYDNVTTGDDTTLFQLKVLGVQSCVTWKDQDEEIKLADITSSVVDNINSRCGCGFIADRILNGAFQCFGSNADSVTFRAHLVGLADVTSTTLATYVAEWVAMDPTVLLQNVHFLLDSNCQDEVIINDILDPECVQVMAESSSLGTGAAAGITAAAILTAVLLVGGVIMLAVFLRRRHQEKVTLDRIAKLISQDPQERGNTILLRARRDSTSSVNSNEMVYNEHYQSSTFTDSQAINDSAVDNPMYANPAAAGSDFTKIKQGEPLPPLPTIYEELDGYAVPSTVTPQKPSNARHPNDYLQPTHTSDSSEEKLLAPLDSSTVITNRSSGIYEDPDYATMRVLKTVPGECSFDGNKKGEEAAVENGSREGVSEVNTSGKAAVVGEYEQPANQKITPK